MTVISSSGPKQFGAVTVIVTLAEPPFEIGPMVGGIPTSHSFSTVRSNVSASPVLFVTSTVKESVSPGGPLWLSGEMSISTGGVE